MPARPTLVLCWIVALSALATAPGHAQGTPPAPAAPPASDTAKDLVAGAWEISNSDRDKRCPVSFSAEAAPGGFRLELDPACAILPLKEVVAWTLGPKDVLRLVDANKAPVLEFTEVESGL